MSKGHSVHVGLNRVDPAGYEGWDGELNAAVNDARSMQALCAAQGFDSTLLLDDAATAGSVLEHLGRVASEMDAGDIFVLTYSGHGGQLPDASSDEADAADETWCLFDRELVDDELAAAWTHFPPGARVLVMADSCHSGTVVKAKLYEQLLTSVELNKELGRRTKRARERPIVWRTIPKPVQTKVYAAHRELYDGLRQDARARVRDAATVRSGKPRTKGRGSEQRLTYRDDATIAATVLGISACQDVQLAADGDFNGLFTGLALAVWEEGRFEGTYRDYWAEIARRSPVTQSPQYLVIGASNTAFELQRPFTVSAPVEGTSGTAGPGTSGTPSVRGPASVDGDDEPPTFEIDLAGAVTSVLEIADRPEYLDAAVLARESDPDAFWATWQEAGGRIAGSRYRLPEAVWRRLSHNDQLWYRVYTTTTTTGWTGWRVSTPDGAGHDAPSITVRHAPPAGSGGIRITGPGTASRAGDPPVFTVELGGRYGLLEIAALPEYLDRARTDREADTARFWATWLHRSARFTGSRHALDPDAWRALRGAQRLWFRLLTTDGATGWRGYAASVPDGQGAAAPQLTITP